MKNLLAILSLSLSPILATAADFGKIVSDSKSVQLNGQKLKKGDLLSSEGKIITGKEEGARIELHPTSTILEIAPGSTVEVKAADVDGTQSITLHGGMVRAKVVKKTSKKPIFTLRTQVATMGVRGTDFLAIANPVLGESEIVVFEGDVDFTSTADAKDVKHVTKGYWGGIGGRFGAKTHELIQLPASAMKHFDDVSSLK